MQCCVALACCRPMRLKPSHSIKADWLGVTRSDSLPACVHGNACAVYKVPVCAVLLCKLSQFVHACWMVWTQGSAFPAYQVTRPLTLDPVCIRGTAVVGLCNCRGPMSVCKVCGCIEPLRFSTLFRRGTLCFVCISSYVCSAPSMCMPAALVRMYVLPCERIVQLWRCFSESGCTTVHPVTLFNVTRFFGFVVSDGCINYASIGSLILQQLEP